MPNSTDVIEALIFASERPVTAQKLAEAAQIAPDEVESAIRALIAEKESVGALRLVEVAGGWHFVTKPAFASYVRRLRDEKKARLSRAAFEVLAIVAYRQPVTRGEIDHLRGVESGGPLNFLLERKLVAPAGRRESPGKPWLFKSTPQFLEQFGLKSLEDLPSLEEFSALDAVGGHPQTLNLFAKPKMESIFTPEVEAGVGPQAETEPDLETSALSETIAEEVNAPDTPFQGDVTEDSA